MPIKKDLPPKYYLHHFRESREDLARLYEAFFLEEHHRFLQLFDDLSEDAQCLFLRLLNRKGAFFFVQDLRAYQEIEHFEEALRELRQMKFVRAPEKEDWSLLVEFLPKYQLLLCAERKGIAVKRSWPVTKLREAVREASSSELFREELVVQLFQKEIRYLLFLYFGELKESLILYTMRDLGIRSASAKGVKARFTSLEESLCAWTYAELEASPLPLPDVSTWPSPRGVYSEDLRERLLLRKAQEVSPENKGEILALCMSYPGTEKFIRHLYKEGSREECQKKLEVMLEHPSCDEELLFAQDFLAMKFANKRTSILTDTLRSSKTLAIDEAWFRSPEEGVIAEFEARGARALHTENWLWSTIFGLLYWEEIFESEKSAIHNPFERYSSDLNSDRFYFLHEESIRKKTETVCLERLLRKAEEKNGQANGVFGWHESLTEMLTLFFSAAPLKAVQEMLLWLAKGFSARSSGFPDLMVVEKGKLKFVEVKAQGDSLKRRQLLQIENLKKAGFEVEVLQVQYAANPDQIYTVVDLETTGGMAQFHRIIEIGAVKVKGREVIEKFQTLVNPKRRISEEIQELTGITNDMVKEAPVFSEVAESFLEFTKGSIFVAHNVGFDYGFLQEEYERIGMKFVRPFLCTKQSMKRHYPGLDSYSLKNLTTRFGIALTTHHRALCDAEAAAGLLFLVNEKRLSVSSLDTPEKELINSQTN